MTLNVLFHIVMSYILSSFHIVMSYILTSYHIVMSRFMMQSRSVSYIIVSCMKCKFILLLIVFIIQTGKFCRIEFPFHNLNLIS